MDLFQDDRYLVFLRVDSAHTKNPETNEEPLAECHSYQEARRVKDEMRRDCVIRFSGSSGGGD
ncbi:MAG TPA: hypothetical protein VE988_08580 [Gemmataceae bacterium]|nr:hypothetical protein [Gemmataceae bacterium]